MQIIRIHEYFKIRFIFSYYRLPLLFIYLHEKTDLFIRCVTLDQLLSFLSIIFLIFKLGVS